MLARQRAGKSNPLGWGSPKGRYTPVAYMNGRAPPLVRSTVSAASLSLELCNKAGSLL